MEEMHARTCALLGEEGLARLAAARVLLLGVGGVGSYTAEVLARTGVGHVTLVDPDNVAASNINRQLPATHKTVGRPKVQVMQERMEEIAPHMTVEALPLFVLPGNIGELRLTTYDYIIDAIDTVSAKLALIGKACELNIPMVSALGAGNKLDGSRFRLGDIYETKACPLARVLRRELRKMGVPRHRVVWSDEEAVSQAGPPGSLAFVTGAAGMLLAQEAVMTLVRK